MSRRMHRQIYWLYLNCILHLIYIFRYKDSKPTYFIYYKKQKSTPFGVLRAENEIRTRDPRLGKAMLYH